MRTIFAGMLAMHMRTLLRSSHRSEALRMSGAEQACRTSAAPVRCTEFMYGRRPPCKRNLTFAAMVGCGHVFGLLLQPAFGRWP